jgi:N utilization substance protein B
MGNMANRQLFRTTVLQTLFEWDMRGYQNEALSSYLSYTISSFNNTPDEDITEMLTVVEGVGKKRIVIDEIIEKAAPDWPLSKISITDRNIIRFGLYELLFGDQSVVPPKVAINEAVELAKRFGGPKSNKFVNGILGAVYREIGEPGKDQVTKSKMPEVIYEDMPIDQKGSAVVFSRDANNVIRIGMVHDFFGYWTLAKGSIDEGETTEAGTIREVKEKTNWDITIVDALGDNEYIAYPPERGPVRKHVEYFLAESAHTQPTLEVGTGGLDDVRWFELPEITDLNIYDDVSKMLIRAINMILGHDPEGEVVEEEATKKNIADQKKHLVANEEESVDVSDLKVTELKELAKKEEIAGYSKMKKAELIEALS